MIKGILLLFVNLTVPESLDVGECLIGGSKVSCFTVRNLGGAGRFCVMPSSKWPSRNFKVMHRICNSYLTLMRFMLNIITRFRLHIAVMAALNITKM